jgi:phospholipid transport system substrate-binding protein
VGAAVTRVREIVEAGGPAGAGGDSLAARRARVQQVVDDIVDFREMSRRALGAHWSALSPGQQREFVDLFTRLMEQSYLGRVDTFFGQRVDYLGQTVDGDTAVVTLAVGAMPRSEITQEYGRVRRASELTCWLHRPDGRWRIFDVSVDGLELVSIYRSQFARVLRQESFAALLDRLRRKVDATAATVTGP